MDYNALWQAALGDLQLQMTKATFDTWLKDTFVFGAQDNTLTIAVRNVYAREWLENRLLPTIRRTLARITSDPIEVAFAVRRVGSRPAISQPDGSDQPDEPKQPDRPKTSTQPRAVSAHIPSSKLNGKYTFVNFIVGNSNRLAHAASLAVAENPAQTYNPLFIYGGVGLGKTHLLQAIAYHAHQDRPEVSALYVSSETFTNDLIESIRRSSTDAFRHKYRSIDILLIDDIQFIAGKERTQEEFFHTFNTLHSAGRQIVISSDRPPRSVPTLEDRLRSRFEGGLIADIQPPTLETRTAILRTKSETQPVAVPAEVIDHIVHRITSNIRDMEGALNRVVAYSCIMGLPLTRELAAEALQDMTLRSSPVTPTQIIAAVSHFYGVAEADLLGSIRSKSISLPRQVAMYLLREDSRISFPQIGEELGGRDHSTIMYGHQKISRTLASDNHLRQDIVTIRQRIVSPAV